MINGEYSAIDHGANTALLTAARQLDALLTGGSFHSPPAGGSVDEAVSHLSVRLFDSFKRKDQRERAEQYLRCLLITKGRKSIRNLATAHGGASLEQQLHHFIASSTWDWRPIRSKLATLVDEASTPQAWVVRSMPIPKAGEHSIGVQRSFDLRRGNYFRGQQAFGVWSASQDLSVPINWRLYLPDPWLEDKVLRGRGDVPDDAVGESLDQCAVAAALDTARRFGPAGRPVLMTTPANATQPAMARFTAAGVPAVLRISPSYPVVANEPGLPSYGKGPAAAVQLLEGVRGSRRLMAAPLTGGSSSGRPAFAAAVPVSLAGPRGDACGSMLLFGEWQDALRPPRRMWLTNLADLPVSRLLRLTRLAERVERDFDDIGEEVGLRDYVGRSFRGWHRHVTIASVAHAAMALRLL